MTHPDDKFTEDEVVTAEQAATDAESRYQARERELRESARSKRVDELFMQGLGPLRPLFERPPIERYVRCSVDLPGGSLELGLFYNRGEPLRGLSDKLGELATKAARVVDGPITLEIAEMLSAELEANIVAQWGDRAWFLEVWNADSALTQIYAPHGMPRRS